MMFSGLRSRWTTPRAWAQASASSTWVIRWRASSQPRLSLARQYLPQRGTRHVLEDGVERTVFGLPGIDQANDVRVGEFGAEPHLASEAGDLVLDVPGGVALPEAEGLDGDRLPGGTLAALVDPTEAAFAQLGENLVAARESGAD